MGKMKNRRQKLHTAAVKLKNSEKDVTEKKMDSASHQPTQQKKPIREPSLNPVMGSDGSLFAGINIDINSLKRNLPDMDARSTITSKSLKGTSISKKDKRKFKHDCFIQKIDAIQTAKKEAKNKKKRKKLPVVGDMQVLADSLPTLELLLKDCEKKKEEREKNRNRVSKKSIPRMKTRQKRLLNDISTFNQVLTHPAYKSDAKATMKEHLQNWMKQQEDQDKQK